MFQLAGILNKVILFHHLQDISEIKKFVGSDRAITPSIHSGDTIDRVSE